MWINKQTSKQANKQTSKQANKQTTHPINANDLSLADPSSQDFLKQEFNNFFFTESEKPGKIL